MERWQTYGARDTPLKSEQDAVFTGLDMTRDRGLLPPGMIARGENNRMRNGNAERRPGNILPGDFQAPFASPIIGSGIYSNPNSEEVMLVVTENANYVWQLKLGEGWTQIFLDTGLDVIGAERVRFVQAFDKVLLLKKPWPDGALTNYVWSGVVGDTFDLMALSTELGGGTLVPARANGESFQNRVLFYNAFSTWVGSRDGFIMSDVLDYTQYDDIFGLFRINAAESDSIVRIWGYYQGAVVVFKKRSLHLLSNFSVDPLQSVQNLLTRRLGLAATDAVTEDGHDLLFLSEPGGIYRLSEVIQEQIATEAVPASDPIQPIIDRINWEGTADWGCAATIKDYAFFGVCLDDETAGCNAVLVLNLRTRQWESAPDYFGGGMLINALHVTKAEHGLGLYGLDYAARKVYQMYSGNDVDEIGDTTVPIAHVIETRGYTLGAPDEFKRFDRASIAVATNNPNAAITAITDGENELKAIRTITKDRTKFYQQDHPDFVTGGNASEAFRKDYSTVPAVVTDNNFVAEDFDELPEGEITELPATPIASSLEIVKQQTIEPISLRVNGRWLSIRCVNATGTCDLLSVGIEGRQIRARQVAA